MTADEREPLLSRNAESESQDGLAATAKKRQLGVFSAIFLIFNRVIGTGIYATPSVILRSAGSVGVALLMWIVGALIAACGSLTFLEIGTGLPRNGGEKNFLEYFYRRPEFAATCIFTFYSLIMGSPSANAVVFGEYVLNAFQIAPTGSNVRFLAFLCLTFIVLVHGLLPKTGLVLQNTLGVLKLFVLSLIALTGLLSLFGVPALQVLPDYNQPDNFSSWSKIWDGSASDANGLVTGLYSVIWSFIGYSQVNYVLSEVRNPIRTVKIAAPAALLLVTAIYLLVNIAYFAVVAKEDIVGSRTIAAALYFRNLFGKSTERALSLFIALSVLGNLLAGQFTQGRVIQELGRTGILPFPAFFSSSAPFGAPLAGLFAEYAVACVFMLAPPASDVYLFLISTASYCLNIINTLVAIGVLLLSASSFKKWNWAPPYKAPRLIVLLFLLSNVFLLVVPLVPPRSEQSRIYVRLPYWSHAVTSFCISLVGIAFWYVRCRWLPRRRGHALVREWVSDQDGVGRWLFKEVPLAGAGAGAGS